MVLAQRFFEELGFLNELLGDFLLLIDLFEAEPLLTCCLFRGVPEQLALALFLKAQIHVALFRGLL